MEEIIDRPNASGSQPSTKSVGIRYGLILALISIAYFIITTVAEVDMSRGIQRWAMLIVSAVMCFLAHKYYKENGDGFMSYGQGFNVGLWMGIVSSVISSIFTYVYIKLIDDSFISNIREKAIQDMEEKGSSEEEIEMAMKFVNWFANAEVIFVMGIVFGIIGAIIVALLVSIITKKENPQPSW